MANNNRKTYMINAYLVDTATGEDDGIRRRYNFSRPDHRDRLNKLIFAALNTGKGVAIELDKVIEGG